MSVVGWVLSFSHLTEEQASSSKIADGLPLSLVALINEIRGLSLPRRSTFHPKNEPTAAFLMKEKKAHEVTRMSAYVGQLADDLSIRHAVDIGAGQVGLWLRS